MKQGLLFPIVIIVFFLTLAFSAQHVVLANDATPTPQIEESAPKNLESPSPVANATETEAPKAIEAENKSELADDNRIPVTISEDSPLTLRVLTRPQAVLYADASEATPIEGQVPVFQSFFVYTRPAGEAREGGTGWYEVGTDEQGKIAGWLKASDIFEWKQTMCLAYSHPEGRKPVLMFEDETVLDKLLKEVPETRQSEVEKLYNAIDAVATTPLAEDFPIISVEPKLAVDMAKQFYLLPILEHKEISLESYEGRMLLLAAVSCKADAKRDAPSDIRTNLEYATASTADEDAHAQSKANLKFDIVWVMDTTRSMQPYIEDIRNILENMSQSLGAKKEVGDRISFGIWAYRDSETIKDIGYLTKNFTPELQPLTSFVETLKEVKETTTDSIDVEEDVFAGVHDAITKTAWREGAIRIVILVGDAPAHEAGHKWNSTKLDETTLRTIANENKVTIFGIHVSPKIRAKYNNLAQRQFKGLTKNPGSDRSMLWSVKSDEREMFQQNSQLLTQNLATFLENALNESKGSAHISPSESEESTTESSSTSSAAQPTEKDIQKMLGAATVTWLGSVAEVEPPSDVEAWVTDKDLLNPAIQALEVRLLISKRQLDSLAAMLNDIVDAGTEAQMTSEDFFSSLQSVAATASRNADQLAKATTLQESGLVPAFLQGLPYESQVMSMSSELWESLGPDEQDMFIESLRSKVAAYQSLHDTPDNWVALNEGDSADDFMTPIPLDLLP